MRKGPKKANKQKAGTAMATFNLPADGYRAALEKVERIANERGVRRYAVVRDMVRCYAETQGVEE